MPERPSLGCTGSCLGWEFDLWVKTASGIYIGPGDPGDLLDPPYVIFPRDSLWDRIFPAETIVIGNAAEDGVYKVFVERPNFDGHWNPSWTGSQASVQSYSGATSVSGHIPAPPSGCGTNRYWHVGNLSKSGTVYTWSKVDLCTNTRP
jgi:hypothetical protein